MTLLSGAAAGVAILWVDGSLAPGPAAALAVVLGITWILARSRAPRGRPAPNAPVEALKAIALAMEARDPYTRGHCLRVRHLTRRLLTRLDVAPGARSAIETAAFLHDVGKVGVSDLLLQKEGRLTPEEKDRLMLHVEIGVELVSAVPDLADVCPLVKHHHEKFDGTGYPEGLRGEAIPFGSRVIAVADAIDAMRSKRPYRAALPLETVIDELRRSSGTQLDPRIAAAGIALLSAQAAHAAGSAAPHEEHAAELPEEAGVLV